MVAFAAHGRPLGSNAGTGSGLPPTFWDFVFTTLVILEGLMLVVGLVAWFVLRRFPRPREQRRSYENRTLRALAILIGLSTLLVFVGRHVDLNHLLHPHGNAGTHKGATLPPRVLGRQTDRHAKFRWEELAIVLGLLLVVGAAAAVTRRRLGPTTQRHPAASELLADALDESLDDLREDPDLRGAIIAAYARMERALAAAGLPRHHAEAPLEYMERALLTLETSSEAVRRLTDLFEWARFSQHEPEPSMRDEAVEALMAVRDELRAAEWVVT